MGEIKVTRREVIRQTGVAAFSLAAASVTGAVGGAWTPAFAENTLDRLRKQGFARVGIWNEPPYTEVKSDGKVTGGAVEVARAVLAKMGVPEVVGTVSEFSAMIPGLQAGRFDIVTAGLFIKPERCGIVLFSEPDLCDAEGFMVKKGNPLKLASYADVAKHPTAKFVGFAGATEERLALEAGVPRDRVIVVPDGPSAVKMLQAGRVDVFGIALMSLKDLMTKTNDPALEVVGPLKDTPMYCAGAAFQKADVALRDAYDKVLAEMKQSGEFKKIIEQFGFSAELTSLTSRAKICGGPN